VLFCRLPLLTLCPKLEAFHLRYLLRILVRLDWKIILSLWFSWRIERAAKRLQKNGVFFGDLQCFYEQFGFGTAPLEVSQPLHRVAPASWLTGRFVPLKRRRYLRSRPSLPSQSSFASPQYFIPKRQPRVAPPLPIKHWNFNQFPFQFDVGEIFNVSWIPRTFYRI